MFFNNYRQQYNPDLCFLIRVTLQDVHMFKECYFQGESSSKVQRTLICFKNYGNLKFHVHGSFRQDISATTLIH